MIKKIVMIVLSLFLILPVFAESVDTKAEKVATPTADTPFKEPISTRQYAFKFLYAMGGVVVSSLILFVGLSVYNKIRSKVVKVATNDYANTFNSPTNLKDAVNIYLEKTKD